MVRKLAVWVGFAFVAVPVAVYAATLISSHQVTNAHYAVDGNTATAASPATAALSYCPSGSGFGFLGNRCIHGGSGTQFYGYEVLSASGSATCHFLIELLHAETAGSGPPAQTHVYYSVDGGATWRYAQTLISSTSIQSSKIYLDLGVAGLTSQLRVVLAKSTASMAPPTGPNLNWYEAYVTLRPSDSQCWF